MKNILLLTALTLSLNVLASGPIVAKLKRVTCEKGVLAPGIENACLVKLLFKDELLTVGFGLVVPYKRGKAYMNSVGTMVPLSNSAWYTPLDMVNAAANEYFKQLDPDYEYMSADSI